MNAARDGLPLRDVVAAIAKHAAMATAGIVTIPLVAYKLGSDALGAWTLLGTASFVLGLADLGTSVAVQRLGVRAGAEARLRACRGVAVSLTVVLVVLPVLCWLSYALLLDVPVLEAALAATPEAPALVLAAGAIAALAFPFRGFVLARGGIQQLAWARIWASLAQVGITWWLLSRGAGLRAPALGLLASSVVDVGGTLRAARAMDDNLSLLPALPRSRAELLELLRDGSAACAINLGAIVALRVDVAALVRVAPLSAVAGYGVVTRAVDQAYTLAKQLSAALLPRLGDPKRRAVACRLGTAALAALVASGMAALVLVGDPLMQAWAGEAASGPTARISLSLLALAATITSAHEVAAAALMLGGRSGWSSAGPLAAGHAVNAVVSFGLAPRFGIWAVAGGTLLGAICSSLLIWRAISRVLGWRVTDVVAVLAPPAAGGGLACVTAMWLANGSDGGVIEGLARCAITIVIGLASTAGCMWLLARRESPSRADGPRTVEVGA
jgi:hypothetical protein